MRDYADIVASLREAPGDWPDKDLHYQAADAIEELLNRDVVPMDFHERCLELEVHKRIEIEKQMPHWISVEEPPDNGRNIFICHGSADFKAPCIGHYEPNMKLFYEDKNWFASPIYDAMYWCEMPELPFPEAPKEVRDA